MEWETVGRCWPTVDALAVRGTAEPETLRLVSPPTRRLLCKRVPTFAQVMLLLTTADSVTGKEGGARHPRWPASATLLWGLPTGLGGRTMGVKR